MGKFIDLTNQKFGKLIAIKPVPSNRQKQQFWICLCECGNQTLVSNGDLKSGNVKSCGCLKSWKEEVITTFLTETGIKFEKEYSFKNLFDKRLLRYDFAIFKNEILFGLIEYNGEQHYIPKDYYDFPTIQKHDKMKIDYCLKNNIPLLILNKQNINFKQDILNFIKKEGD